MAKSSWIDIVARATLLASHRQRSDDYVRTELRIRCEALLPCKSKLPGTKNCYRDDITYSCLFLLHVSREWL